jgi:hypothetical protein
MLYAVIAGGGCVTADGVLYYVAERGEWRVYLREYGAWSHIHHPPFTDGGFGGDGGCEWMDGMEVKCSLVYFEFEHCVKKKVRVMVCGTRDESNVRK